MSFGSYDPTKQATSGFQRRKTFYLKDGSNLYRVLPPTGSLREKNQIAKYWSVIWLTDSKGKKRVVNSILRKGQDKVVLQHDPLITRIEEMEKQLSHAVATNENPATILALKENLKRMRSSKFYALNVLDASGALGVLQIPYTSYQSLDKRLKELNTQGIDAIGIGPDKGLFFDFKKGKDEKGRTVYTVDPAVRTTKDQSGQFIMSYIRMPISEEDAVRLGQQAEDLTTLFRTLSVEEQTALATMDQRVFDAIFAKPVNNGGAEDDGSGPDEETQNNLMQYQNQQVQQPVQQVVQQQPVMQQAPVYQQQQTTVPVQQPVMQTPVMPTMPAAPVTNFGQQGSVVQNAQVKNFLFPDANKKV